MLYQIGLILILIVIALVIGKKFKTPVENKESLIYEDEMSPDELKDLDDEIN
ncbi:hypothetical protein OAM40_01605 [Gammaproteobacteria bacterium]|jgi:hypothetical protein|nr:hypothetical protein [Gammaproteobacteria bacterium]|tara:strand:+ start:328 stop:483 length:156 start_codon:yes stop_codon:yes gene_type:complete